MSSGRGYQRKEKPLSIEIDGTTINDAQKVAQHFVGYFSKIGQTLQRDNNQSLKSIRCHELRDDRGSRLAFEFEMCSSEEPLKMEALAPIQWG